MSLDDRDWYREEMRERAKRELRSRPAVRTSHRVGAGSNVPWRGIVVALVLLFFVALALDVRSVGAPLTKAGVAFWWKVRSGSR